MNDLTLCIVNEGSTYTANLALARSLYLFTPGAAAYEWLQRARYGARLIRREQGITHSTADILQAASELAAYYAEHIAEIDEVDGETVAGEA